MDVSGFFFKNTNQQIVNLILSVYFTENNNKCISISKTDKTFTVFNKISFCKFCKLLKVDLYRFFNER